MPIPITTGQAGQIVGKTARTIDHWVDTRRILGGQPGGPGSHRWVDARDAVRKALQGGRASLIPARWRHLIAEVAAADQGVEQADSVGSEGSEGSPRIP